MSGWRDRKKTSPEKATEGDQSSVTTTKDSSAMTGESETRSQMDSSDKESAILGKGSEFEGKLTFDGTVRINGKMKGEIHSKEKLIIGEGAVVEAEINVGTAVVSGTVKGNINATKEIELLGNAKLTGNLKTPSLTIEKGVIFEGNSSMSGSDSGPKSAPSPTISGSKPEAGKQEP